MNKHEVECKRRVLDFIRIASKYFRTEFTVPQILFNLRGKCAGQAIGKHTIRLNADLLERYPDQILDSTLPHEMAHIIVKHIWPRAKPHGKEWRLVMSLLGIDNAKRCHSMAVKPARIHMKFSYRCNCSDRQHLVGSRVHERIQNGLTYFCKACKSNIRSTV